MLYDEIERKDLTIVPLERPKIGYSQSNQQSNEDCPTSAEIAQEDVQESKLVYFDKPLELKNTGTDNNQSEKLVENLPDGINLENLFDLANNEDQSE